MVLSNQFKDITATWKFGDVRQYELFQHPPDSFLCETAELFQ
jgi:hypothetical protein